MFMLGFYISRLWPVFGSHGRAGRGYGRHNLTKNKLFLVTKGMKTLLKLFLVIFNPRSLPPFSAQRGEIGPQSRIGETTVKLLLLNTAGKKCFVIASVACPPEVEGRLAASMGLAMSPSGDDFWQKFEKTLGKNEHCSLYLHCSLQASDMTTSSKIQQRRAREKQEMKDRIVQAAREMFLEEGFEKVSIRKIADRIAYSVGTIYNYFKNKDELFHAVHEMGFQILYARLDALMEIEDPIARLKKMGEEYWDFGLNHPDDYDLMFVIRAPMQADEESEGQWTCGFRTFGLLQQTIVDCQKAGYLQGHDPNALSFMVWSTVHGMVSLVIRDRLKMYNHDIRHQLGQTAIHSLNQLLRSWDT
jgi:AcrR family transcriptional regulator